MMANSIDNKKMDQVYNKIFLGKLSMLGYLREEKEMALANYVMKKEVMRNFVDFGLMEL